MTQRTMRYAPSRFGDIAPVSTRDALTAQANEILSELGDIQALVSHLHAAGLDPNLSLVIQQTIDQVNNEVGAVAATISTITTSGSGDVAEALGGYQDQVTGLKNQLLSAETSLRKGTLSNVFVWGLVGIGAASLAAFWIISQSENR